MALTGNMRDRYASTMAGIAAYTLAQWEFQNTYTPFDESDAMLRTGRMGAYADVLQQLTGKRDPAFWREIAGVFNSPLMSNSDADYRDRD